MDIILGIFIKCHCCLSTEPDHPVTLKTILKDWILKYNIAWFWDPNWAKNDPKESFIFMSFLYSYCLYHTMLEKFKDSVDSKYGCEIVGPNQAKIVCLQGFPSWGNGVSPPSSDENLLIPSTFKSTPPPKVNSLPLNNNFYVITQ